MKKKIQNGIKYNNGHFQSGEITKAMRKRHKEIPACDTIYLKLEPQGVFASMTYDEAVGIAMMLTESAWYLMPHKNRYKKGSTMKKL